MNVRTSKFFLRSVCFTVTGLSLGLALIVLVSRLRLPPEDGLTALGLDLCDGKACFLGITPGLTTWSQARTILAPYPNAHFDEFGFHDDNAEWDAHGYHLSATPPPPAPLPPGDGPNGILVDAGHSRISIESIIEKYGPPCGVSLIPLLCDTLSRCTGWSSLTLNYHTLQVQVPLDTETVPLQRLSPDMLISLVQIGKPLGLPGDAKTCSVVLPGQKPSVNVPWRGFASFDSYFQHGQFSAANGTNSAP